MVKKTIECSGNVHETQDNVTCTFLIQQMLRYATLRYVILGFVMLRYVIRIMYTTYLSLVVFVSFPSSFLS